MTRLAMQFPHIRKSFRSCKQVFDICAGERGHISVNEVRPLLIQLGARDETLSDEEIERIVHTSDLSSDNQLDFREFLIAAAVGCFLRPMDEDSRLSPEFVSNRKGFAVAREAFDAIDEDSSGEIDYEELKIAFLAMKHGSQDDELTQARLNELDFNGDRAIEFPEFVWGIIAWVGMDSDGDDDSEYFVDANTTKNANYAPTPQQRLSADFADHDTLPLELDA
jgi:Ca2+-binding EF-hand superfamily protein